MNSPIRVALLGPPEVRVGNEVVPIAGTKLQSLLAMLALAAPHPVSDDRLLEELWGDDQPAKPANALQALVSNLRRRARARCRRAAGIRLRLARRSRPGRRHPPRTPRAAGPRRRRPRRARGGR